MVEPRVGGDNGELTAEEVDDQASTDGGEEEEADAVVTIALDEGAGGDFGIEVEVLGLEAFEEGEVLFGDGELLALGFGEVGGLDSAGVVFPFGFGLISTGALFRIGEGVFQDGDLLALFFYEGWNDIGFRHARRIDSSAANG